MTPNADSESGYIQSAQVPAEHSHNGSIGEKVIRGAAFLWLTTVFLRISQLATTAILGRLLTPADYGVVALATTVVGFLDLLSNLQLGNAIIRTPDLTRDHVDTAFTLNIIRGAFTALILIFGAHPVSLFLKSPHLAFVLYALALSALISSIHNPHLILYAKNMEFRQNALRNAAAAIVGSLVGIFAALLCHSYWALVAASMTNSIVSMVLSYWRVPGRARLCVKKWSELVSFGSWLLLINILDYVNGRVDYVLIGRGAGTKVLGEYHMGQQTTMTATGDIVGPISNTLLPAFSMMASDKDRLRRAYSSMQSMTLSIVLPLGFGVSVLAEPTVRLLVGNKWLLAIPVIRFLAPLSALQSTSAGVESLALVLGRGRLLFIRTFIYFLARCMLMVAGFVMGGFMGIIYARVIAGTFFFLYGLFLAGRLIGGNPLYPLFASWRSFIAVAIMWFSLHLTTNATAFHAQTFIMFEDFVADILLGAFIYVSVHYLLWRLAGRPEGIERRIITRGMVIMRSVLRKYTSTRPA